jgi:hypothetical protein
MPELGSNVSTNCQVPAGEGGLLSAAAAFVAKATSNADISTIVFAWRFIAFSFARGFVST